MIYKLNGVHCTIYVRFTSTKGHPKETWCGIFRKYFVTLIHIKDCQHSDHINKKNKKNYRIKRDDDDTNETQSPQQHPLMAWLLSMAERYGLNAESYVELEEP